MEHGHWVVDWSKVVDAGVTLTAAFAGAWAAFSFERWQNTRDERQRRIASANRALLTIYNMWNIQEQFRKEEIEACRGKPDAWLNLSATAPREYGMSKFEAADLLFLLDEDVQIYADLLLEEQRFGDAVKLIESRSQILLNEAWPRLTAGGIKLGEQRNGNEMERIVGADVVQKLKIMTDGVIKNIDENLKTLRVAHDNLRTVMKRRYPGQKFVSFTAT